MPHLLLLHHQPKDWKKACSRQLSLNFNTDVCTEPNVSGSGQILLELPNSIFHQFSKGRQRVSRKQPTSFSFASWYRNSAIDIKSLWWCLMASRIMASTSGVSPDKGTLLWMFLFEIGIRSIRDLCLAAQFSGQIQKNYFIHSEST